DVPPASCARGRRCAIQSVARVGSGVRLRDGRSGEASRVRGARDGIALSAGLRLQAEHLAHSSKQTRILLGLLLVEGDQNVEAIAHWPDVTSPEAAGSG